MTSKLRASILPAVVLLIALGLDGIAATPPEVQPGIVDRTVSTIDKSASSVEDALKLRALGPLFNAGEAISQSVKPLQDPRVRQQLGELVNPNLPYARRSRQAFQRFSAGVQKAGNALEKAGKGARWYASGNAFDNLANLSEGLGSLYERDMVGVAQTGANTGLSGASAAAGAWPGAKLGAGVGMVLGGPPGAALGGVVGGVGGAIAGSYAYDAYVKPELDKAADSVSVELQRRQEQANKFLRRVETDRVLLQQHGRSSLDILFERDGRSPFATLLGVDGADLSDSQAERIHQRAEEIRAQQMVQRVQALPSDGIDARLKALRRLHERANDSEGRARLTREIAMLTRRQHDELAQTAPICAVHGDCPAGYLCSSAGLCVADTRGSGQDAVRLRAELEQRRLAGASAGASVLGSTPASATPTTTLGSRFGLGQMPGGATRRPTATPNPTPVPAQHGSWYVFEAQFSYTDEQLKQHCTSTHRWTLSFTTPSQAEAFLATLGPQALRTVRDTHTEATLVSSRRVSGPSLTMPAASDRQGATVSVRCQ